VEKNVQITRKNSNKKPLNWLLNSGIAARRLAVDLVLPLPIFPAGYVNTARISRLLAEK